MELRIDILTNFSKALADIRAFENEIGRLGDGGKAFSAQLDVIAKKRFANQVGVDAKEAAKHVNNLYNEAQKLAKVDTSGVSRGFAAIRSSLGGYKDALLSLPGAAVLTNPWTAVAAGIGYAVKTSTDFERSLSNVRALLTNPGESFDEAVFANLEATIKSLGASSIFTAKQVAEGAGELAALGFTAKETTEALEGVVNLASVDPTVSLANAAQITGSILRQFGIDASESAKVVDILAATSVKSAAGVLDISEAMKFLGPTAASLGVSLEETSSIIGLLANRGLLGGNATRALGTSLVNLASPTTGAKKAIAELGIEAFNQQGKFIGLLPFLQEYTDKTKVLTEQQRAAYTSTIFGNESYQELAIIMDALKDPTSKAGLEFAALKTGIEEAAGSAALIAEIKLDNLSGDFEKLTGAIDGVALTAGGIGNDALRTLTQTATNLIEIFSSSAPGEFGADLDDLKTKNEALTVAIQNENLTNEERTALQAQITANNEVIKAQTAEQTELSARQAEEIGFVELAWLQATNGAAFFGRTIFNVITAAIKIVGGFAFGIASGLTTALLTVGENFAILGRNIRSIFQASVNAAEGSTKAIPIFFKNAGALAVNFFGQKLQSLQGTINSVLSALSLPTINIPIPNLQLEGVSSSISGLGAELESFKSVSGSAADAFGSVFSIAADSAKADFGDISDAYAAGAKIEEDFIAKRKKRGAAIRAGITADTTPAAAANATGIPGAGGAAGGGTKGAVKKEQSDITKVVVDEYRKRFAELEKIQEEAKLSGEVTKLRDATKQFADLEKDVLDIYGELPIEILNSVKNQQLFTSEVEKTKKREADMKKLAEETAKEVKKHAEQVVSLNKEYVNAKTKADDLRKSATELEKTFGDSGIAQSNEVATQANITAQERLFKLYREQLALQKQINEEQDPVKKQELLDAQEKLNQSISSTASFVSSDDITAQQTRAGRTDADLEQEAFEVAQAQAKAKQEVLALTTKEELQAAVEKLDGEVKAIAEKRLAELQKVEDAKNAAIKAEEEVSKKREELEDSIALVRQESIEKAYETEVEKAKEVLDIYKQISALRESSPVDGFGGFRAKGGPVRSGVPYVVGEKGPELFIPRGSGKIIPNHEMYKITPPPLYGTSRQTSSDVNNSKTYNKSFGDVHIHHATSPVVGRLLDRFKR